MASVLICVITPVMNACSSGWIKPQAGVADEEMELRGGDNFCIYFYLNEKSKEPNACSGG